MLVSLSTTFDAKYNCRNKRSYATVELVGSQIKVDPLANDYTCHGGICRTTPVCLGVL